MYKFLTLFLLASALAGCAGSADLANSEQEDTTKTSLQPANASPAGGVSLLSAFYGLDDDLPALSGFFICEGARGSDGMPVIFSHELDMSTVQAGDFLVTLADGSKGAVVCVTPAPAYDVGELRSILLVGDFGSIDNQPVSVEVRGNVLSLDQRFNFRGSRVDVIPLEEGPSLILAEIVPEGEWELGKRATLFPFGGGGGCPESTRQVVRVVWTGGVTKPGGDPIDDEERLAYSVTVDDGTGNPVTITPFAIADLGDGDNNHELCLDVETPAIRVDFPEGLLTDPREDLNPATGISVTGAGVPGN